MIEFKGGSLMMNKDIKQQICEIRIKPNSLFMDNRGMLISIISKATGLEEWNMSQDTLNVYDKNKNKKMFATYNRFGFVINGSVTRDGFKNELIRLIDIILSIEFFSSSLYIDRIGIRTRNCISYNNTFEKLRESILKNYINIQPKLLETLNMKLDDIGFPLNFIDGDAKVNSFCGPMMKGQIKEYFNEYKNPFEYPDVGLYIDFDYYCTPQRIVISNDLIKIVSKYCDNSEEKVAIVQKLILG